MRILIIGPSIERSKGGTATVIYEHLNNSNLNTHNDLTYLASHVDGSKLEKLSKLLRCVYEIVFRNRLYDIIHIHANSDISFYRKTVLLRISKWFNKKTIMHLHGHDFDTFYRNNTFQRKKYIRNSLEKSDLIIVLSDYWKKFFDMEFPQLKTETVHNGVDIDAYKVSRRMPSNFKNYLFMGRLGERKGVYDLIKAINKVVNELGYKHLRFFLAGDGDLDRVEAIINDKNLTENIKIMGWLNNEDKRKLLREVEVVVLPSYEENLPMALIESMACGKIIISTYAGGIPDLVQAHINGYLHKAGDIEELVNHIIFVSENSELMSTISENNIATIKNNFNLDTLSVKLNAIYNSL